MPICGHATIAAMYAKAIEENIETCILNMKTNIGVLPFEIQKTLLGILGLEFQELDHRCPIQIASTGHSKVMIGIKSRNKLNNLNPNLSELSRLSKRIYCNGSYVFTLDSNSLDILCYGRMFAPAIGINEDPVTGNANGPLGAYLIHNDIVDTTNDTFNFKSAQGETIGRDDIVEVSVSLIDKKPTLVRIAGEAIIVFKTIIEVR